MKHDPSIKLSRLHGANGVLPIKLPFWQGAALALDVIGGPFDKYKPGQNADVGVCVRAERVPKTADFNLAIEDFQVPPPEMRDAFEATLIEVIRLSLAGKRVWVGCMGGYGRTGLFLAVLAKACGVRDPVAYVREHYHGHAVETSAQRAYVGDFDVSRVQSWLFWHSWSIRWTNPWSWFR